jgi:cation-transporting ATPase E
MVPAGLLLIASEFLRSHDSLRDAARGSAAGVVGMVPEGLVLLTSLAFAAGALRLARRRVLVQELAAIEGLARADVLCIDKTGTLTEPGLRLLATEVVTGRAGAPVAEVIGALAAADEAPNETGRLLSAHYPAPAGWTVRRRVPFSSARKWSGATFDSHGTWLLGAPSVVAGAGMPDAVAAAVREHEAACRRVLLLASADGLLDGATPTGGPESARPEPAALIVLAEELRPDAAASVRYLLEEGITIKVLSGDAPRAVAAIVDRAGYRPTARRATPPR